MMSKAKQLFLAALISCASTAAMADMGRTSHSVGPVMEDALVRGASWESRDVATVPLNTTNTREDAFL